MKLVKAVKITEDGRTKQLVGLARGDNLEVRGVMREIVEYAERNRGLYKIITLRITSGIKPSIPYSLRQEYFASTEMLQNGELALTGDPSRSFVAKQDQHFYTSNLIKTTSSEVTA